jgi:hypothetical protein
VSSGVAFFVGEGLFFLGLSLGILGSTTQDTSRQAAWILLTIGVLSLLLAGLILSYKRRKAPLVQTGRTNLRPLSLGRSFDSLLQSSQSSTLLEGEGFRSELLMAVSPIELELAPHQTLIVQHFAGLGVSFEVDLQSAELGPGDVLRISSSPDARRISIAALEVSDDFETSRSSERAPQILAHFIKDQDPS